MYRAILFATLALTVPFDGCRHNPLCAAEPPAARAELPALRDANGKPVVPFAHKDTKVVVFAFLSFKCPVARDYADPLSKLAAEYGPKGVTVIGVVSNDTPEAVAKLAAEYKTGFPVAVDRELVAADALKAECTPEVFVLDADRVVRYRGRVDDKWGAKMKPNARVTRHDLREALDEVLAGKAVSVPKTDCIGCELPRAKTLPLVPTTVTYHKDVLPILQNRCQECHRPGEAGPFSLLTYKEAVTWAGDIKEYTQNRKMPPWKATGGMKFQHDRRLPATEIDTLAKWADGGTPEGNPKDAPPAKVFTKGWTLGEPDLVLTVDEDFHLGARGPDHYRCFVLPTGLTEDKFVVGYEVRPGTATVVHHVLNFFDTTGTARKMDREARAKAKTGAPGDDHGPGYESVMGIGFTPTDPSQIGGLGGWAPGLRGTSAPTGTGMLLPKASDIVLQIHYHRNGKPEKDRTKIGLYFAKDKGAAELKRLKSLRVYGLVAASDDFAPFEVIPAGRSGYRVTGKVKIEEDCRVYAALPHMHMLGTKVRILMAAPDEKERVLVEIGEWDYAWQELYRLVEPLDAKAGTVFSVEAEYDNSAKNPFNPNSPPKDVKRGEGTADEMLIGFLSVTSPSPGGAVIVKPLPEKADYVVRTPDVIYGRKDGTALTMDVFRPAAKSNGAGVVLLASAGYASSPDLMDARYVREMLRRGYTVFYTVHGSEPLYTVPEARDDVRRAVRFVRYSASTYGIDPDRIAVSGVSSGGNLALLMAVAPQDGNPIATDPVERVACKVRAVGVFFPPTDFLNYWGPGRELESKQIPAVYRPAFEFKELDHKNGAFVRIGAVASDAGLLARWVGAAKRQAVFRDISPIYQVGPKSAPTLFVHGNWDFVVPLHHSETMHATLREAGVPARLIVKNRGLHGWPTLSDDMTLMADWFDEHVVK